MPSLRLYRKNTVEAALRRERAAFGLRRPYSKSLIAPMQFRVEFNSMSRGALMQLAYCQEKGSAAP